MKFCGDKINRCMVETKHVTALRLSVLVKAEGGSDFSVHTCSLSARGAFDVLRHDVEKGYKPR